MSALPTGAMRPQNTASLPRPGRAPARPLTPPDFDSHFLDSSPSRDQHGAELQLEPADANGGQRATGYPDPITPTKTPWSSGLLPKDGLSQYPFTPESIRSTKSSYPDRPLCPLPSMPWNTQDSCPSPMQDALLVCASQLENLIQTREPTDEQMEYLVSKFEDMARFLSAPDAQSRQTDDHLFSEVEGLADPTGLDTVREETTSDHHDAYDLALSQGYILEVGNYVEAVKRHVQDLTMRMDEVRQLNSIQLDIISDLRRELKNKSSHQLRHRSSQLQLTNGDSDLNQDSSKKLPFQRIGFWSAIGEALDAVGEMLYEW